MRWPRPTVSMYCAQSGVRDVVDLLGKVPNKLSVDRLECCVWDSGVHTECNTGVVCGTVYGH